MEIDLNTDVEEIKKVEEQIDKEELMEVYNNIIDVLRYYCDLDERYYPLLSLWAIGCANHKSFLSFPYIFLNAMKGSGKSRLLSLMAYLCNGTVLNSLTESVLFRSQEMLAIDEFEGINRKGYENLKELLNSAYKKGAKVRRMKKAFTPKGEEQIVEQFEVYRPIMIANISGAESVLEDRCLFLILEKSNNPLIVNKAEVWEDDTIPLKIRGFLAKSCRLCHVVACISVYRGWNYYLEHKLHNDINNTNNTNNTNDINTIFYDKIYDSGITGRNFELCYPLLFISNILGEKVFDDTLGILKSLIEEKRSEDLAESQDVTLIDFISQEPEEGQWISVKSLLERFKASTGVNDDWINERWLGKALRRLKLFKDKKRMTQGRLYILDIQKAQEKMRMFR